jgi:hypothetical protein
MGYQDPRRSALAVISRGIAGLAELSFELEPGHRGTGGGAKLARDALSAVPPCELAVASVAPGNAASLRALLAARFKPLGSLQLFRRLEAWSDVTDVSGDLVTFRTTYVFESDGSPDLGIDAPLPRPCSGHGLAGSSRLHRGRGPRRPRPPPPASSSSSPPGTSRTGGAGRSPGRKYWTKPSVRIYATLMRAAACDRAGSGAHRFARVR